MYRLYVYENDGEMYYRTTGNTRYGEITLEDLLDDVKFWRAEGNKYSLRLTYIDDVTLHETVMFDN